MRLRRFVGPDVATATRRVRQHLGPEAVILGTRAHPEGIEITAAVDSELVMAPLRTAAAVGAAAVTGLGAAPADAAAFTSIAQELHALRAHLAEIDRTLAPLRDHDGALSPEGRDLARRLAVAGFPAAIGDAVAARYDAERRGGADMRAALAAGIAAALLPLPAPADARITAVVGPTGAGKTTTIAKLAAAERRAGAAIGLVMADTYRIGAGEQLGTYARLLGVPMRVARDAAELRAALDAFADRDRVWIDTTGLSGDDAVAADVTHLLAAAGEPLAVTAVMSAATADQALARVWARLDALAPASCVLTKADEGASAAVCAWLAQHGVPLRWIGTGQRVPEDLVPASGDALADFLVAA